MVARWSRRRVLGTLGVTAAAVGGCMGPDVEVGGAVTATGRPGGNAVDMTDRSTFEPAAITVAVGDAVTWRNVGSLAHTVTAYGDRIPDGADYFASGGFQSERAARDGYPRGQILPGKTYAHAFEVPGAYAYFCIPHEKVGMTGSVTVTDG